MFHGGKAIMDVKKGNSSSLRTGSLIKSILKSLILFTPILYELIGIKSIWIHMRINEIVDSWSCWLSGGKLKLFRIVRY